MKKLVLATTILLLAGYTANAQTKPLLNIYGGYVFQDKVSLDSYYGYIKDAGQWGAGLEFMVTKNKSVELKYLRMDTHTPLYYYNSGIQANKGEDAASINYILVEGTGYMPTRSAASPYGGVGIGVGIADSKDDGGSLTKLAMEAKIGVKIKASPAVAFKAQAQLQSMIQGIGGGFYVGTGGSGAGVTTYSTVLQFGFLAGLVFSFK